MSEHITHIAVYEDSCTLLKLGKTFPAVFAESVWKYPDSGLTASASRGNHLYAMPILDRLKRKKTLTENDMKQLAAALGWLTHRAADLTMKPLFRETDKLSAETGIPDDIHEIYHDAFTFRYVYENGRRKSISPKVNLSAATLQTDMKSLKGAALLDFPSLEVQMAGMINSEVFGLHAFASQQPSDWDQWFTVFFDTRQRLYEDLNKYIKAYQDPDPAMVERFITTPNYYNDQDDLLQLVRAHQHGQPLPAIDLEAAVQRASTQSQYTQAVALSYRFLEKASQFYKNEIKASETYDALDITPKEHRIVQDA